jgi:hypothetical protein
MNSKNFLQRRVRDSGSRENHQINIGTIVVSDINANIILGSYQFSPKGPDLGKSLGSISETKIVSGINADTNLRNKISPQIGLKMFSKSTFTLT